MHIRKRSRSFILCNVSRCLHEGRAGLVFLTQVTQVLDLRFDSSAKYGAPGTYLSSIVSYYVSRCSFQQNPCRMTSAGLCRKFINRYPHFLQDMQQPGKKL